MADIDVSSAVARQVQEIQKAGGELTDDALNQLAKQITTAFRVKNDEVSILRLSADGRMLSFLYPLRLSKVGAIPLTLTHSLAAKTVRERKSAVVNNFFSYKHPTVFEAVNLSDEDSAAPIQKIMSVPMIVDAAVIGVIQVSRKAKVSGPAGPDFTAQQLGELTSVATVLAKFLVTRPPPPPFPVKS